MKQYQRLAWQLNVSSFVIQIALCPEGNCSSAVQRRHQKCVHWNAVSDSQNLRGNDMYIFHVSHSLNINVQDPHVPQCYSRSTDHFFGYGKKKSCSSSLTLSQNDAITWIYSVFYFVGGGGGVSGKPRSRFSDAKIASYRHDSHWMWLFCFCWGRTSKRDLSYTDPVMMRRIVLSLQWVGLTFRSWCMNPCCGCSCRCYDLLNKHSQILLIGVLRQHQHYLWYLDATESDNKPFSSLSPNPSRSLSWMLP